MDVCLDLFNIVKIIAIIEGDRVREYGYFRFYFLVVLIVLVESVMNYREEVGGTRVVVEGVLFIVVNEILGRIVYKVVYEYDGFLSYRNYSFIVDNLYDKMEME